MLIMIQHEAIIIVYYTVELRTMDTGKRPVVHVGGSTNFDHMWGLL